MNFRGYLETVITSKLHFWALGGRGKTSTCRDMGMCHHFGFFWDAPRFLDTFLGLFPDFWVLFILKIYYFSRNNQYFWY